MTRWLSIVGIGEDGLDGLGASARAAIAEAKVLIGGTRHLAMVPDDGRERIAWPSPLSVLVDEIVARRGEAICVLGSGDPLCWGIGVTLVKRVPIEEMRILPAPSALSLACARMGWPAAETETVTLHGRPLASVNAHLYPGARLLALSNDGDTPAALAAHLAGCGYGASPMTVLERMGGPGERRHHAIAADWSASVGDLNTIAVDCVAAPGTPVRARVPGLADDAFDHDGQITKREQRAVTLSALAPLPGRLLWDVGAGAGSVAIEWMRSHPTCRAIAVERQGGRCARIAANAARLGVPTLAVVEGEAPAALAGLEAPDAVFLGGGVANPALWDACWQALKPGGRLVANAVTLAGEAELLRRQQATGGALSRIAVSRATALGDGLAWQALRPVTQLTADKP